MKKIITTILLTAVISLVSKAQDYITRNGNVSFYSHTPLEDIKAENNEAVSTLNSQTGDIEFKIAIKSFHFAKTAMEEHFNNADYMNSVQYPKASFKGKITHVSAVSFSKDGIYKVTVQGELTLKNNTKPVSAQGTVTINNGSIIAQSKFNVNRKDYDVIGESFVQKKINDQLEITVNCKYDKR